MSNDPDRELLERVRVELDRSARELDEFTVARLRAARKQALAAGPRGRWWLAIAGVATAAVTAGLVAILLVTPAAAPPPANGLDQLELLADAEFDVANDLEFYRWLAEQRRAG